MQVADPRESVNLRRITLRIRSGLLQCRGQLVRKQFTLPVAGTEIFQHVRHTGFADPRRCIPAHLAQVLGSQQILAGNVPLLAHVIDHLLGSFQAVRGIRVLLGPGAGVRQTVFGCPQLWARDSREIHSSRATARLRRLLSL